MFKIKETVHISLINVYCDFFHLKRERIKKWRMKKNRKEKKRNKKKSRKRDRLCNRKLSIPAVTNLVKQRRMCIMLIDLVHSPVIHADFPNGRTLGFSVRRCRSDDLEKETGTDSEKEDKGEDGFDRFIH